MSLRQRKKQKVLGTEENPAPVLRHLVKSKHSLDHLPTPGAVHGCRVAVQGGKDDLSDLAVYCATGAHVFHVKPDLSNLPRLEQGKEGVYIPTTIQASQASPVPSITHATEVQHLELLETLESVLLGSIDAYGSAMVSCFDRQAGAAGAYTPSQNYVLMPPYPECREGGWSGISFSPHQPTIAATARQFARAVTMHDGDVALKSFSTLGYPTALKLLPVSGAQILMLAEGHQVSIWDVRAGGSSSSGCVQRVNIAVAGFVVNSLAWCDLAGAGLMGAAGSDRSVSLLDPRKWRLLTKWSGCSKGSIWHLSFSSLDPHYCYVSGLDQEVVGGRWDAAPARTMFQTHGNHGAGPANTGAIAASAPDNAAAAAGLGDNTVAAPIDSISFRGDSRWLGVAKTAQSDVLVGLGASNNLFVAAFQSQSSSNEGKEA